MSKSTDNRLRRGAEPARFARAISFALAGVLFFAAFAFGGVHGWASALLELVVWVVGLVWYLAGSRGGAGREGRAFGLSGLVLCLYLGFQVVPLPPGVLAVLSPETADLYLHTLGVLESVTEPAGPIGSAGVKEDGSIPVSVRERISDLSRAREGWWPERWRPLAVYPFSTRSDLLLYLAYGVVIWLAATSPEPGFLFRSCFVAGAAVAGLAIVQSITWNGHLLWFFDPYDAGASAYYPRLTGPFVSPDHLAAFLEMTFLVGVALAATLWAREDRGDGRAGRDLGWNVLAYGLIGLGLVVIVAVLIGSGSRGGIVGAMLGLAAFWWGVMKRAAEREKRKPNEARGARPLEALLRRVGPAVVAVAIIAAGITYSGTSARHVLDVRVAHAVFGNDFEGRLLLWRQSLPVVGDFPLFGVGAGCWREIFYRYEHYPMVGFRHNHAHCDYIEWCTEVGLVGILLTALLAASFLRWASLNRSIPRPVGWSIIGGIVAIGWHEVVDFSLRIPANAFMLAMLLGLLCNRQWRNGRRRSTAPRSRQVVLEREGPSGESSLGRSRSTTREVEIVVESRRGVGRGVTGIVGFVGVFAVLSLASVRQFREFRQWAAVRSASPVLHFAPQNAETWSELGHLLYRSGFRYLPPTRDCLRAAIRRQPSSGESFWTLALSSTLSSARARLIEAALYLEPTRAYWRLTYATLLDSDGQREDALKQIEEAVYRDPRLSQHPYLNPTDKRNGEALLDAVKKGFQRALADRPDDPNLLNEVASLHYRYGRFDEAASLWLRARKQSPDRVTYGLLAANSYLRALDYDRAEKYAREVIDEAPGRSDAYRLLAISVLVSQKKYEDAEKVLDLGIRRSDDPVPLWAARYELEMGRGNRKAALDALAKAADLAPRSIDLQIQLGNAYFAAEDYHRAGIAFERAIRLDGKRAQLYYDKGVARERLYDFAGARDAYRRALEIEPANQSYVENVARMKKAFEEARNQRQ